MKNDKLKTQSPVEIVDRPLPGAEYPAEVGDVTSKKDIFEPGSIRDQDIPERVIARELISESFDSHARQFLDQFRFGAKGSLKIGNYVNGTYGQMLLSNDGLVMKNQAGVESLKLDPVTGTIAFADYTPVWSSTGTAPAIGNGSITGKYIRIGDLCIGYCAVLMNSTTTYGTGDYIFSLPLSTDEPSDQSLGNAILVDNGVGQFDAGVLKYDADNIQLVYQNGRITNTNPFTFTTSDKIRIKFMYKISD